MGTEGCWEREPCKGCQPGKAAWSLGGRNSQPGTRVLLDKPEQPWSPAEEAWHGSPWGTGCRLGLWVPFLWELGDIWPLASPQAPRFVPHLANMELEAQKLHRLPVSLLFRETNFISTSKEVSGALQGALVPKWTLVTSQGHVALASRVHCTNAAAQNICEVRNKSISRVGQRQWCFLTLPMLLLEPRENGGALPLPLPWKTMRKIWLPPPLTLENNEQPHKGETLELGLAVSIGVL